MKNYYEILEVSSKASIEVIEKAYKALVKKYHPDGRKTLREEEKILREKRMKEINEAYAVLSSEFLREQYDKELNNMPNEYQNNKRKTRNEREEVESKERRFADTTSSENIIGICKNIFSKRPNIKNLKELTKNDYLSIGLTIVVMIIFLVILWFIPFTKPFIMAIIDVF